MKWIAKAFFVLGVIWIAVSFSICFAIEHSHVMQGGMADHIFMPAEKMSYEDQWLWVGWVFGTSLVLGLAGAATVLFSFVLYLVSLLIRKPTLPAAQA